MRDRSQRRQVFDWLMCWSIFTQAHGIVSENINHLNFRQCCQADSRSHVIGERHERSPIRNQTTVQRDTRERRSHCMFAHTKMEDAAVVSAGLEAAALL